MQLAKVLARKDAYSLIVAITIAMALNSLLMNYGYSLSSKVADNSDAGMGFPVGQNFTNQYVVPAVSFIVQIVLLEFIIRAVNYSMSKKSKK